MASNLSNQAKIKGKTKLKLNCKSIWVLQLANMSSNLKNLLLAVRLAKHPGLNHLNWTGELTYSLTLKLLKLLRSLLKFCLSIVLETLKSFAKLKR